MGDLVKMPRFKVKKTPSRLVHFEEKVRHVRSFLRNNRKSGFLIVAYAKRSDGNFREMASYGLVDTSDTYILPEMAKAAVIRTRESPNGD